MLPSDVQKRRTNLTRSYGQGYRWFGFGGGSHRCRGEQFAYVQIKTIWAYLLRNFDMKLSSKLPEPDYTAMVVGPLKPYVRRLLSSHNIYLNMARGIQAHEHEIHSFCRCKVLYRRRVLSDDGK